MAFSVTCHGGVAMLSMPEYIANNSFTQVTNGGSWLPSNGSLNATSGIWLVSGLGIKFNQNVTTINDVLSTLAYSKNIDNVCTF